MEELVALLIDKNISIGTCESLTGGLFASELSSIANVSKVFKGSIVSYSNETKVKILKVDEQLLNEVGAVSGAVARQMAENGASILDVDCCVSFTGNAGPSSLEGKPCGLVYTAIANRGEVFVYEFQLYGSRNEIREEICFKMVEKCKEILGL